MEKTEKTSRSIKEVSADIRSAGIKEEKPAVEQPVEADPEPHVPEPHKKSPAEMAQDPALAMEVDQETLNDMGASGFAASGSNATREVTP